jgi:mono/diheme cytochrome c family protein
MSARLAHARPFIVCGLLGGLLGLGCASTQTGATADDLTRARGQAAEGASTYANECARCHGQRGEGLSGPAVLGPGALPEYPRNNVTAGDPTLYDPQMIQIQAQTRPAGAPSRDPFRNALDLYNYTATHVPKERAAQLKQSDYWAIVTFLLAAQGASVPPRGITPADAASIPIPRR